MTDTLETEGLPSVRFLHDVPATPGQYLATILLTLLALAACWSGISALMLGVGWPIVNYALSTSNTFLLFIVLLATNWIWVILIERLRMFALSWVVEKTDHETAWLGVSLAIGLVAGILYGWVSLGGHLLLSQALANVVYSLAFLKFGGSIGQFRKGFRATLAIHLVVEYALIMLAFVGWLFFV